MAILSDIRATLNGEIGVLSDSETGPWSVAVRNSAISAGYAALKRVGVWKPVTQDIATVSDQQTYTTTVWQLYDVELIDSVGAIVGHPICYIDELPTGFTLKLRLPMASGLILRVKGWAPYISVFASDAAADDLPAELGRLPILKARSILYGQQLSRWARYSSAQAAPGDLNVSISDLLAIKAACEQEWVRETHAVAVQRQKISQPADARPR